MEISETIKIIMGLFTDDLIKLLENRDEPQAPSDGEEFYLGHCGKYEVWLTNDGELAIYDRETKKWIC